MIEHTQEPNCVPNINADQRRMRLISGLVMFGLGLLLLVAMIVLDLDPLWRLGLYPVFTGAAIGYFQSRDKTWVALAARGSRILDNGLEQIEDSIELDRVKRQGRIVLVKSAALALPVTILAVLI